MEAAEGASRRWLFRKTPLRTRVLSQLREEGLLPHAGAGRDRDGAAAGAGAGDVGAHEEEGDVADLPRGPALEGERGREEADEYRTRQGTSVQPSPSCPSSSVIPARTPSPPSPLCGDAVGRFFHTPPTSATGLISDGEPRELPKLGTALTTVRRAPFLKQGWKVMSWGCAPRSPRRKPLKGGKEKPQLEHDRRGTGKTQRFRRGLWLSGDVGALPGCTGQGQPEAKGFEADNGQYGQNATNSGVKR